MVYDPDEKIYSLAELGETPKNYRSETLTNVDGDIIAQIVWDNNDRMVLFAMYPDCGGTVVVSTTYDSEGNIISNTFTTLDEDGTIIDTVETTAQTTTLASAKSSTLLLTGDSAILASSTPEAAPVRVDEFGYDHLGNRNTVYLNKGVMAQETHEYSHNLVNQYSGYEGSFLGGAVSSTYSFAYDDNGNLSVDENGNTYFYDYRNRLIEVQDPNSDTIAEYSFDALGRRISKTVDGTTTYFIFDPQGRVIAEYEDGTTPTLKKEYVWGNGINEILAMFNHPELTTDPDDWDEFMELIEAWLCQDPNDACYNPDYDDNNDDVVNLTDFSAFADDWEIYPETETRYYYLTDALGSVRGLVGGRFKRDSDCEFYNYDVYGKLSIQETQESKSDNPYLFAGNRHDAETELDLAGRRMYGSHTGRWLQIDIKGYIDGMNLYEYVASNPIIYIDPYGTNLYAIGGTWEKYQDNFNVSKFYNYYVGDDGPKVNSWKRYWDGPGTKKLKYFNGATGYDSKDIIDSTYYYVCQDYCKDNNVKINLVGWSRGGVIALEVAKKIGDHGCICCDKNCRITSGSPAINWIGLFDAVDMSPVMEQNTKLLRVRSIFHATKTKKRFRQRLFPTEQLDGISERIEYTERSFPETSHEDIGTLSAPLLQMMKNAEQHGLQFNWSSYVNENNPRLVAR